MAVKDSAQIAQTLVAAAGLGIVIAWVAYQLLPEKVLLRDGSIVKKYKRQIDQMAISNVAEIKYHYHAVVGFVAVWEFLDRNGKSLSISAEARGISNVLSGLEKHLAGFSLADFKRKFEEGDVEDSIDVWKAG